MNTNKVLAALAVVGSLSLATACGAGAGPTAGQPAAEPPAAGSSGAAAPRQGGQGQAQGGQGQAAPSPDLSGVPAVVATVNGEDIGKDEFTQVYESQFQQMAMQAQMSGQALDQSQLKKSTAESLVGTELLMQQAEKRNITASEAQVSKALNEAAKSNQMSGKEFLAAMEQRGMDREQVDRQLNQQVVVESLLKEELGTFTATDKELKAAYDQAKQQQGQAPSQSGGAPKLPPFDKVKPQLKEQVVQQKEGEGAQKLVERLRADADVKVHL